MRVAGATLIVVAIGSLFSVLRYRVASAQAPTGRQALYSQNCSNNVERLSAMGPQFLPESVSSPTKTSGKVSCGTCSIKGPHVVATTLNLSQDLVRLGIASSNMTPNQPGLDAGPLFMAGVNYAKANGISTVVADPGAYYFLSIWNVPNSNTHVAVSGIDNMTIDLHGADLIFSHPLYYGLSVFTSTNAVVENFTVDYQPLPFTQLRVDAVDVANSRIQYSVEPGWQDPSTFNSVSQPPGSTLDIHVNVFRNGRAILSRWFAQLPFSGNSLHVTNTSGTPLSAIRPNDVVTVSLRGSGDAVGANHCKGCTLRNITVFSCGCGGAAVGAISAESTVLERIYAIPKPGTDRLISTTSAVALGPSGPNNQIRLSRGIRNTDDAFWFYGRVVGVVQTQPGSRTLTVASTTAWTWKNLGDNVANGVAVGFESTLTGAILGSAVIASQGAPANSPPYETSYTFDSDLPGNLVGAVMYTTDASLNGANSIIERSASLSSGCCRGIYVAGLSNGAIQGNYIRQAGFTGIDLVQGMVQGDPPTAPLANLSVRNNVIDGTNLKSDSWWFELGSIQAVTLSTAFDLMTGSPFSNLNITNNFIADSGRSGIWLGNTNGGSITGNYLLNPNARPDVANAYPGRPGDALRPLVVDTTSTGVTTSNNAVDTTSGRLFVTDTQYRELAAYPPGGTLRLSAYNVGTLANPAVTLTDADGVTTPVSIQNTTAHAFDVLIPAGAALGGAYLTLTAGGTKYFGTLFIDSQDNIPAVNGCTYEMSVSSTSEPNTGGSVPILVITQAGCSYQANDPDSFVTINGGGTGTSVVSATFKANTLTSRSTTLEIAGVPITLTQAPAATPTLNLSQDLVSLGIASTNMIPNQPSLDAGPLFLQGVQYANSHGVSRVVTDPGAYYFLSEQQQFVTVSINQVSNLTIDFQGADLYFAALNYGLAFTACSNLVVENFTVDRLQLGYTQLQITSVDAVLRQIHFTVQSGWQKPTALNSLLNNPAVVFSNPAQTDVFIFRNGRLWENYTPMPVQQPFNDDYLVIGSSNFLTSSLLSTIRPGDVAVLRVRVGLNAVLADCTSCMFRNIRVYSGFEGVDLMGPSSSSVLERIYVMPKPGTDRLVSTLADGTTLTQPGPNNTVRLSRSIRTLDDGFSPHIWVWGSVQSVTTARTAVIAGPVAWRTGEAAYPTGILRYYYAAASRTRLYTNPKRQRGIPIFSPADASTSNLFLRILRVLRWPIVPRPICLF